MGCLLTAIAYWPSFRAPYDFDDIAAIVENKTIDHGPLAALRETPERGTALSGRPISNASFAITRAVSRTLTARDQRSYSDVALIVDHTVNLALHLACGVLLGVLIRITLRRRQLSPVIPVGSDAIAVTIATVWMLLPMQTEAVDYIVQRTELLVSLFALATVLASIRSAKGPRSGRWILAATLLCAAGMASKEVMIAVPVVVALYDRAFLYASWQECARRRILLYAGLFATAAWPVTSAIGGARAESAGFASMPWTSYAWSQAWAIPHYVRLAFWPMPLLHDYGSAPVSGIAPVLGAAALMAAVTASVWAWVRSDRWKAAGFLGAWFFLFLAPSSSIIPIRTEIAAERRAYLALAALVTVVILGAVTALCGIARTPRRRVSVAWLVPVTCLFLATATWKRSEEYRDPRVLWQQVVDARPGNARGYVGVGRAILVASADVVGGGRAEARMMFARAVALDSSEVVGWRNLAALFAADGRVDDARAALKQALRFRPGDFDTERQLGLLLAAQGDATGAIMLLTSVHQRMPDDLPVLIALGIASEEQERWRDAEQFLRRALTLTPDDPIALRHLGFVRVEQDGRDGRSMLEQSVIRDSTSAFGWAALALARAEAGDGAAARVAAERAGTQPDTSFRSWILSGRAMAAAHDAPLAMQFFGKALRDKPEDAQALTGLGVAALLGGDQTRATVYFQRALKAMPSYEPARTLLGKLDPASVRRR